MVARGRGKKAAAAGPAVAAEAEAVMANGDASQEAEYASEVVAAAIAPTKKGRQRGVKKETKEEVDETPSVPAVEVIAEKAAKPTKAAKGSRKAPKGKASAAVALVEEDEKVKIPVEDTKDEDLSENDSASIEAKPAVAVEKKASIRKRKVDNIEKAEEIEAVAKKAPRVTKTKGAKKETVDSDGIPEDPAAAVVSITVLPTTQTNGTKKSASRKRGAPKVEEPEPEIIPKETKKHKHNAAAASEKEQKAEDEIPAPVPAKRGFKSKSLKKEPKETKKTATTKSSKRAPKVVAAEEAEEEATEHDILPEDEFVPEIEEEEAEIEEPKPKKVVKSKGSRKQVIPAPTPPLAAIEEDNLHEPMITEDEPEEPIASEKQESEADSASAIEEELPAAQPKSRGRKAGPAAKKKNIISTKKAASKKAPKGGKKATKDEPQENQQVTAAEYIDEKAVDKLMNNEINEEDQDAADVEISKRKINGTAEPETESAAPKAGRGRKRAAPASVPATPITETDKTEKKPGRGRKRVATALPPTIEDSANDNDGDDDVKTETDGSKIAKLDGPLNPTKTEYNSSDFTIDKEFNMKISSWNIAGLRAWLKKDGLSYLQHEKPDILCLQEIKCTPDKLPEEARIPGYHPYWLCMPGGHGGVAVYSKIMPINVEYGIGNAEHDESGRIITAEYEKFYLINVYVQNSGRGLVNLDKRMRWEELFREYLQKLEKVKPVIIAGDMNVSHKEIDLANPKTNTKSAGFTPQEREQMTKLLESGYVDTFRHFHPDQKGAYTFWTYMKNARAKNVGWRLDYFILSERIVSKAVESTIRPQVLGSDHCPITLFLNI
ncbi:recombination repair protein 1 [Eupeodes corollae]|uniref:recombination repair protein 1 n=1 Tax=Eupeodes corollae TaxID=290404 RepID=UPI002493A8CF|nr:recombination repair protein 1 [Eupeodes corollae]